MRIVKMKRFTKQGRKAISTVFVTKKSWFIVRNK